MLTTGRPEHDTPSAVVHLVYHYSDGRDFVTEAMLRTEAIAYMPLLRAARVDADHYEAAFAAIEMRAT